jgi:ribosomal protein L9
MTEEQLAVLCEELFAADPVLAKHLQAITDQEEKIVEYDRRSQARIEEIRVIEARLDELNAELRATTSQKGVLHGYVAHDKYHTKMATARIKQAHQSIEKRKRQLYLSEARRRLGVLGKELKLGIGGYRAGRGLGTVVVDKKVTSENKTAQ